ncbi:lysine transporter LysE [Acrocarpospora phusangensis]|uniref:Lysine transporter LysE n=1 Tax=Acrocarpospora phusangensis TaxID=1070424 RepID=A0A919Q414_9ACTN|nr:LysE family translocator [Acrocarpospora phusangensis]GIH21731.1 lysine transporter LysE [Acrocarpospora phusangensis]
MFLHFLAAAGALAVLTMMPGPDMAVVTKKAVASGWRDGLRTVGGITAGLLVWGVLTVAGLAAVLAASTTAYTILKFAGAAYLLYLGVQALIHSRRQGVEPVVAGPAPAGGPWRTGLINNLLNPKIAVFYTGLLPALAPSELSPHVGMALLVLVHAALTIAWLGGYVMLLSRARAFFAKPRVRRIMDRVTGTVLIGFGLKVAASQP